MYDGERNYVVALAWSQGWSEQCEEIDTWCGKSLFCKLCQKTCTQGHASSRKHQNAVEWWKHYGPLTAYLRASTPATGPTPWAAAAPAPHHQPGSASTPASPGSSAAPHQAGVTAHQNPRPPPPPPPAAASAAAPHQCSSSSSCSASPRQNPRPPGPPPQRQQLQRQQQQQLGPGFAQSTPWAAAAPAPHHQLVAQSTPWAAAAPAPHHQLVDQSTPWAAAASTPASPGSSAAQLFFNPAAGVYWRIPVQYPTNPVNPHQAGVTARWHPPKALPPPPPPRGGSCGDDWTTAPVMIPLGLSPTQLQIQDGISIDLIGLYDSAPPPPPVGAWRPPPLADWVVVELVGTRPTPEEGGDS